MFSKFTSYDRKKLIYLSASACLIAAGYSLLRPLKSSVFFQLVGKEFYPLTKFIMAIVAIPCLGWYSKLVNSYKKQTILYILFSLYTCLCLTLAAFLAHPVFGIANTQPNKYRFLGWIFTVVVDFYPTFVIGTFWAFINSISTPTFAKNNYGIIYAFIKMGSIVATALATISFFVIQNNKTVVPSIVCAGALLTLTSLLFIARIIKKVPQSELRGYAGNEATPTKKLGMFGGVKCLLTNPYVFGIFLLFYCYDVIFNIIEYQAQVQLSIWAGTNTSAMNFVLFLSAAVSQLVGLILAFFVSTRVLNAMQQKFALLIMPIFSVGLVLLLFIAPHLITMVAAMALLPAVHYSLNSPLREMLFIPTVKEIQFSSKAWMDSFGRSLSKSSGSMVNMLFTPQSPLFIMFSTSFSLAVAGAWGIIAYATGKKYQKTIAEKSIIGDQKNS